MRAIKTLIIALGAAVLLSNVSFAERGKSNCCQEAIQAGKECKRKCCLAAHRDGKSCTKCNSSNQDAKLISKKEKKQNDK